jgi:hypothetical protein
MGGAAAEISAFDFSDVISMYTGGVRKNTTNTHRKKYDRTSALRRSAFMLVRAIFSSRCRAG